MFQESADNVENRLRDMIQDVEVLMSDKTDEVFALMRRDYRSIVGGGDVPQDGQILPRDQRLVRKDVMTVIKGVEKAFMSVAELSAKDEEAEEDEEDEEDEHQSSSGKREEPDNSKRESSPSSQLFKNEEEPPRSSVPMVRPAVSMKEAMVDTTSEAESETDLQRLVAQQRLEDPVRNKSESDSDASYGSNASSSE